MATVSELRRVQVGETVREIVNGCVMDARVDAVDIDDEFVHVSRSTGYTSRIVLRKNVYADDETERLIDDLREVAEFANWSIEQLKGGA